MAVLLFVLCLLFVDWLEAFGGTGSIAWGASTASKAWPIVVNAHGTYNDSSLSGDMSMDFERSPASMTAALVPTKIGDMKRTNVIFCQN